ncbi:Hypothetical protein MexAM1_META2p1160 (plasmid) [Methylorubrum extorquens AM1]|uniref:Uncharacterized protein n=1 Tax=Methylorubrum extorquens (strain ATCC 14718 / DSM 1338 / JCM 2805 / NCIMB 9133 / AM1) TaxID=272630 RepID=C5B646_METEA|nr:bifunctional DNA primase/polymerase [Methylorubrum extorquens]ACS43928.1 Hypothetical protein MexAM1_META2p1160 [Methylorubrum extorquens AM1]MCP1546221.1 hypothetical protein [Methylorubrum extorquens]MCP1590888.1 hypothetical protein [Methylorubrum extorquens]
MADNLTPDAVLARYPETARVLERFPEASPLIATVLARLPGAVLIDPADELAEGQVRIAGSAEGRRPYSHCAQRCWENGWVTFPQQRDGDRKPTKGVTYKQWSERAQTLREVIDMTCLRDAAAQNVATVTSAQNRVFVVDVDVQNVAITDAIIRLARRMLGVPFIREYTQSRGKASLIYSTDPANDPVALKRSYPVLSRDGKPTSQAVEILSNNAAFTILGRHWKTGSSFQYRGLHPLRDRPTAAASVTQTQLRAFLERVSEEIVLLGKLQSYQGREVVFEEGAVEGAQVDTDGLVIPGNAKSVRDVSWSAAGKVVDGREQFIRNRAWLYVTRNAGLAVTATGRYALAGALAKEASELFDGLGDHFVSWHGGQGDTDVLCAARARVESAYATMSNRSDWADRVGRDERGRVSLITKVAVAAPKDEALAWLGDDALSRVSVSSIAVAEQDRKRRERAIITDQATREAGQERVARALRDTITGFAAEARAYHGGKKGVSPVTIAKAPTGAGKTSLAVELLSQDVERHGSSGPKLFLLPSYNNIDEVVARARSGRKAKPSNEYLAMATAVANEAQARGLKVAILTGKERGGCLMGPQLAFLREKNQPASALCHLKERLFVPGAPVDAEPIYEETWCRHHPDHPATDGGAPGACPVILARRELAQADLVFAPTVFLTNALPEGLPDAVSGLIVDERCLFELMSFSLLPLSALVPGNRGAPALTAKEKAQGLEAEGWAIERDHAVREALEAIARGQDVAQAFYRDEQLVGCVESAIRVCGRGQRSVGIKPNVTMEKLAELFAVAERTAIVQEQRFWTLVADRIELLKADHLQRRLIEEGELTAKGRSWQARGDHDARVQVLRKGAIWGVEEDMIRLSWRTEPNLPQVPTLLLDASADEAIIRKLWGGRAVRSVEVPAYLHMRTIVCLDRPWVSTGLDVGCAKDDKDAAAISRDIAKIRRLETTIAGVHGWGRVATFAPKRVRRSLRTAHEEPDNVDTGHYGAVRGLDFAKDHAAVITVGRLEFPTWIYDAYAAALTYDDEMPEPPLDVCGNGEGVEMEMADRTLMLRDGRDLAYRVPEMPGAWGRAVQNQMREEEQRQCGGRLRPVYRDGEAPVWVAVSSVFPEGIVVDAVTTVDTLATLKGAADIHEAVRRVGVLDQALIKDQAPELWPHVLKAIGRTGIARDGNAAPAARGLDRHVVRVSRDDPRTGERRVEEREVMIPASAGDAISAAVEAYDRSDIRMERTRLVTRGAVPVPSQVRAPDALDGEIGSRDERRQAEREARAKARAVVPPRLGEDLGEVFEMEGKRPPRDVYYDPIEVEAILIGAGWSPEAARDAAAEEREARAARRAQRRATQNRNQAQAPASHPEPAGGAGA